MQTQAVNNDSLSHYAQPTPDGDIDLVQEVRTRLLNSGLHSKVIEAYDNNRFIVEAENKISDVQRFLLNRYWNSQLMSCNKPSIEERYCLIPNGEIKDWLRLFEQKVLPFVIENELPSVL
jgi:hypothetical protein